MEQGAGHQGRVAIGGAFGRDAEYRRLSIERAGAAGGGLHRPAPGGALDRVRIDRLRRGDWLDIPLQLIGQGKGNPVQVVLGGGTLDTPGRVRRGRGASWAADARGADRLQITDTIYPTDLSAIRHRQGDGRRLYRPAQWRHAGAGAGAAPSGAQCGARGLDDAGGVLRSAGLVKQVVGNLRSPCCRSARAVP